MLRVLGSHDRFPFASSRLQFRVSGLGVTWTSLLGRGTFFGQDSCEETPEKV